MIRRRWWVVAICFLAATGASVALTVRAEKRYESSSGLLLRGGSEPQRTADTNLQLLTLPAVAESASKIEPAVSAEEFEASVGATQEGESDIIQITANAASADLAAKMANAYAEGYVAYREKDGSKLTSGKVTLVERATPEATPVSPKPSKNIGFGALIGIVLGLGLALLLEQMDRRVKREEDIAETMGLPLLASIPKRKAFDDDHLGQGSLTPAETEVFRLLRANLRYFKVQRSMDSVVITSAAPGEGKTLVSLGLALAAVTSGERVLLLEADLRNPGLSRVLGLPTGRGLSAVLTADDGYALEDYVSHINAGALSDAVGGATLDVLGAGAIPPNPTQLLESQRMKDLLTRAEADYDFVVIDTPPVLIVSDAMPLIAAASGVLAVSGVGVSTRNSAADLVEQLERVGAMTLGLVANFARQAGRPYEGYGRPPELTGTQPPGGKR